MKHKYYNNPIHRVSYLPIPKNGMSSIQHALKSEESHSSKTPEYSTFCILRHPVDRFYSAYNELIKRGTFSGTIHDLLQKIKKDGLFDFHIFPQAYYKRTTEKDHLTPKTVKMIEKMYEKDLKLYQKWLI